MEQQLNGAVIGCGRMGAFTSESVIQHAPSCWFPLSHADAISAHPHLKLTALSDTNRTNLIRAAEKYQIERCYDDPLNLLQSEKLHLVGLATRTLGRADLIRTAIDSGVKAIHAEKPLCNSVAELKFLQSLLESNDVFVTLGAVRRFFGIYRQALSLAESGRYGVLREVRVNLGSAPLYWTHPHSIDLLLFAASGRQISGVQARLDNVVNRDGKWTSIESDPKILTASVYFEDGLVGNITQALGADFILSCEHAEIVVRADGASLDLYSPGEGAYPSYSKLEIDAPSCPGGTLGPISQLVACLEGDAISIKANAAVKRDILYGQLIAFAIVQSHLENSRVIMLSDIDPAMKILAVTGGRYA